MTPSRGAARRAVPLIFLLAAGVFALVCGSVELALVLGPWGALGTALIGYLNRWHHSHREQSWLLYGFGLGILAAYPLRAWAVPPWLAGLSLILVLALWVLPRPAAPDGRERWPRTRPIARLISLTFVTFAVTPAAVATGLLVIAVPSAGVWFTVLLACLLLAAVAVYARVAQVGSRSAARSLLVGAAVTALVIASELAQRGAVMAVAWSAVVGLLGGSATLAILRRGRRPTSAPLRAPVLAGMTGLGVGALLMPEPWRSIGSCVLVAAALFAVATRPADRARAVDTVTGARRWVVLAVLSLVVALMPAIDVTALNVALPTLADELDADLGELASIVDAYLVTFAGLLLPFGSLGDRVGRTRLLWMGLLIFAIASYLGGTAASPEWLIFARALQGVGGAMVAPAGLSTVANVFRGRRLGLATGIFTASTGLGIAVGPVTGGWLVDVAGWEWVFFINLPVIAVAFLVGYRLFPESSRPEPPKRFDLLGAGLSTIGLAAVLYAIIEFRSAGSAMDVIATGAGGLALLVLFVLWERRTAHPLLPLKQFRDRRFRAGVASIGLAQFVVLGGFFTLPWYLQGVLGYGPLQAGGALVWVAVGLVPASLVSSWLVGCTSAKVVSGFGALTIGVAMAMITTATVNSGFWEPVGYSLIAIGIGMGLVIPTATHSIAASLRASEAGVGSAMNSAAQAVGSAIGVAAFATLVGEHYEDSMAPAVVGLAPDLAAAASDNLGGAQEVVRLLAAAGHAAAAARLGDAALVAFLDAVTATFAWLAVPVALLGAVAAVAWLEGKVLRRRLMASELASFNDAYRNSSHSPASLEYMRGAAVHGYLTGDRLVAGYVVGTQAPLRYVTRLPEAAAAELSMLLAGRRVVEISYVWRDRERLPQWWRRLHLWGSVLRAARRGGDVLLLGAANQTLATAYEGALRPILYRYEGPVEVDGQRGHGWVMLVRRPALGALVRLVIQMLMSTRRKWARRRTRGPQAPVQPA